METKFEKANQMLQTKKDMGYHFNLSEFMILLESCGFNVGDKLCCVCDEENWTWKGVFATVEEAEQFSNGKYFVEPIKKIEGEVDLPEDWWLNSHFRK